MQEKKKIKRKAILSGLALIGVIGVAALTHLYGLFNAGVLILTALVSIPLMVLFCKSMSIYVGAVRNETVPILQKLLPKAGLTITNTEWKNDNTLLHIEGEFHGERYSFQAEKGSKYVYIQIEPWGWVPSSDSKILTLFEAINEVNADLPFLSVILSDPDEQDKRWIFTSSLTVIPKFQSACYLQTIMSEMYNSRFMLSKAVEKERPYMAQRRGPVGFAVQEENPKEDLAPAAKTNPEVKS